MKNHLYYAPYNPLWENSSKKILIVRLSSFTDTEQSVTHLALYHSIREHEKNCYLDFLFFPLPHLLDKQESFHGILSGHPALDFDLILISNSFTLELLNFPLMIKQWGFPLWASMRSGIYPPIILGGSNALITQSIMNEKGDCLADAVFFGEGEGILSFLTAGLTNTPDKASYLALLQKQIPALWIAGNGEQQIKKNTALELASSDIMTFYPILGDNEALTTKLQISDGCPYHCNFCFEGNNRKPYRNREKKLLLDKARILKAKSGAQTIELLSFNFNTHPDLMELTRELNKIYHKVNLMSQRVDILARQTGLIDFEVEADKKTFALGIEGISERIRLFLDKGINAHDILYVYKRLLTQKIREIKFFYLISGHENEKDLKEFQDFIKQLKLEKMKTNPGLRILFSFNYLVRLPFTPLMYDALFLDESKARQIKGQLKSICETNDFEFRLSSEWEEYVVNQYFSLQDHSSSTVLLELYEKGYYYHPHFQTPSYDIIMEKLKEHHGQTKKWLMEKNLDYPFALPFLEFDKTSLYNAFLKAKEYLTDEQPIDCEKKQKNLTPFPTSNITEIKKIIASKRKLDSFFVRMQIPSDLAGLSSNAILSFINRQIYEYFPEQLDNHLKSAEVLFKQWTKNKDFPWSGQSIFQLYAYKTTSLESALLSKEIPQLPVIEVYPDWNTSFYQGMHFSLTLHSMEKQGFYAYCHALENFFKACYTPVTVIKEQHLLNYQVAPKFQKKKGLLKAILDYREQSLTAYFEVGDKFDFPAFYNLQEELGFAPNLFVHKIL